MKKIIFLYCCWMVNLSLTAQDKINKSENVGVDYNDIHNWAAHPAIKDPSDSLPLDVVKHIVKDTLVDVFFIHPTTLTSKKNNQWNASLEDESLNKKTDLSTILYQASVFNEYSRVYAPRYRQAHLKAFFSKDPQAEAALDFAYQDIRKAFIYFLEHNHQNRPIIIAAHSQGTKHAGRLLKEFFENKPLQQKLVCAYIIGMPVPDNYFKELKPCGDANQTGCFVCWRTYHSGYVPEFIKNENFKCIVVNPLSWKLTEEKISKKENKGGVLMNFNKIKKQVASAQIHQNVLWSCKPDIPGKIFIRKKNYHIGDINLYYMNIRENVKQRIDQYYLHNK